MRIILLQNVENLGKEGDIKEVANGYARNYLFPRKLAEPATRQALARWQQKFLVKQKKEKKVIKDKKELMAMLSSLTLAFKMKTDEGGTLFASITTEKIAQELAERGCQLSAKKIKLEKPIKKIGEYTVPININGQQANIKIIVQPEKENSGS